MTSPTPPGPAATAASLRGNTVANVAGRTASALVWVAVTPWALERMGSERFGVWSLFFALSGSLALVDFGLAPAVTRFVALHAARGEGRALRAVVGRGRSAAAVLAAVWIVAGVLAGPLFCRLFKVPAPMTAEAVRALALFGAALAALSAGQVWQAGLAGVQRLDLANAAWLAGLVVHLVTLVLTLSRGAGLVGAGAAALAGNLLMALLSWGWFERQAAKIPARDEGRTPGWRLMGEYGGIVQLTNLLIFAQMQGGRALLGVLGGLAAVTTFELAFRVANTLWSVAVLVQGALVPAAARHGGAGHDELRDLYRWGLRWMNLLAASVLCALWVMGGTLMSAWLGDRAPVDTGVLRALALGFLLATPALAGASIARGAGRPALEAQFFALALLLQLAAAVALVPRFGAAGAAYALAGSLALAAVVMMVRVHRWLGIRSAGVVVADVARRWAPGIAAALTVALVLRPGLTHGRADALAKLAVQGSLYLVALFAFGLLSGDSQSLLRRARMPRTA